MINPDHFTRPILDELIARREGQLLIVDEFQLRKALEKAVSVGIEEGKHMSIQHSRIITPRQKYPIALRIASAALGVTRGHLSRVLRGERVGLSLERRYQALIGK